jgi:hypothetical protein
MRDEYQEDEGVWQLKPVRVQVGERVRSTALQGKVNQTFDSWSIHEIYRLALTPRSWN